MGVIETIRNAAKLAQQQGNVEVSQALLDVQRAALELVEQNQALREENANLRCGRRACWWAPSMSARPKPVGIEDVSQ